MSMMCQMIRMISSGQIEIVLLEKENLDALTIKCADSQNFVWFSKNF